MNSPSYIFIVDDDEAARSSVEALVASMDVVVQSFASAEEFISQYQRQRPACLITDHRMPGMNGEQLVEQLKQNGIHLSIIVLTAYPETKTTVRAMVNGAINLLEKPCNPQELWDSINQGLELDAQNLKEEQEKQSAKELFKALTKKEMEVLEMMVHGMTSKAIAKRLSFSTRTIESRRAQIFSKCNVRSLAELMVLWIKSQDKQK